jgi:hypothetical protein
MNIEKKIKVILLALSAVFLLLSILCFFYFESAVIFFMFTAFFFLSAFLGLEIYLRIQHNIDKKADSFWGITKRILDNQISVERYVDGFKKDTLIFFEKVLDKLEADKQKSDDKFLAEKGDFDRKMEIAFDKFEFTRKETISKMEKISDKNDDILLSLKAFWSLHKLNDNTQPKINGRLAQLENRIKELEKKLDNKHI